MTYTVAAGLGVAGALVVDLGVLRTRLVTRQVFWWTYPIVLAFQLLANGVLTGAGVVRYAPDAVTGLRIGYAPVEDLGFGFALVLVTLSVWVWLGRRGLDRTPVAGDRRARTTRQPPAAQTDVRADPRPPTRPGDRP